MSPIVCIFSNIHISEKCNLLFSLLQISYTILKMFYSYIFSTINNLGVLVTFFTILVVVLDKGNINSSAAAASVTAALNVGLLPISTCFIHNYT